ncbi:MAG: undecaprenyldiphospho-muramoylpentapeptide beta-N-acetylglucosaminyltransferase [Rhodocyclaceae bacterium]|nr:undecaprenyldiphospho-muramoylpentapeptide beta-N-acetylglucosaminyltransferase [Rhodocyclaceae bacterium]
MNASRRLLIMAGGTGGHIFPGLAIAQTMQARGWEISWLGTAHGMENELVPRAGIPLDTVEFSGLRGKGAGHALRGGLALVRSYFRARDILSRRQPDVVLGMGGYVTVPGGLAATRQGRPLVLVNADAAPLLSNRFLGRHAQKVLFGFAGDFGSLGGKAVVTGNPVRRDICELPPPAERYGKRDGALRILVVGGSLGARALNEVLPAALELIAPAMRPLVTHQTGRANLEAVKTSYANFGVEAEILPFIEDMPRRLAETDLVICRAGAITISELSAAGVASMLVPLVVSTTAHQRDNAEYMAREGAAMHLPQGSLTPERLAQVILAMDREEAQKFAQAAYRLGRRQAAEDVADILEGVVKK